MKIWNNIGIGWKKFQALFYRCCGRDYMCGCGHTAKWKTLLTFVGYSGIYCLKGEIPKYCPQCWANAAIKCAWCGDTILPGDAITLYSPRDEENFQIPEHAVVYKREPRLQLVGCLNWNCATTGADRAGFWVMPGKVQRVTSPLEMLMANGGTDAVIVEDLTDPKEAILIPNDLPS